jgi:long-chain acyl-CoA synthetase
VTSNSFPRLKAGILSKVEKSSGLAKFFFNQAYASKKAAVSVGKDTPLWNTIVFSKFKAALGGNVRFVVSGGAPLSKECGEFLRVYVPVVSLSSPCLSCFGVPVLQGYALTETVAGGTLGELDDLSAATNVGPPICAVEMKLVDCPEMGYTHNDPEPRGEIWIRGPNVSKGYYKNPEKT